MSVYSDIVAALQVRVQAATDEGTVHAYERWNANWSDYLDQFKSTIGGVDQIRGWVVTMDEQNPIVGGMGSARYGAITRVYNALVFGVMGLKDSSNTETTFLNLVESVLDVLDGRTDLGLAAVVDYSVGPATVRLYQHRMFGSVLCHYCEIAVPVEVTKELTYA